MSRTVSDLPILPDIEVQESLHGTWEKLLDALAVTLNVPAALIMRVHERQIEVFSKSGNPENVYGKGERADLNSGLYCETVMKTQSELLVPDSMQDEEWAHNPDVELGMISYLGLPIAWPSGEVFGTICVLDTGENHYSTPNRALLERFRDIVEVGLASSCREHELDREVRAKREELEAVERELRQSRKLEAIGRLTGGIAHDFNNLLTVILGYGESLAGRLGRHGQDHADLDQMLEAGERAATLTRQLLAFGRQQALQPEVLELGAFVDGMRDLLVRLIGENIRIETRSAPDLGHVEVDPSQLTQVVLNLAVNARDAMPAGGELHIATAVVQAEETTPSDHEPLPPGSYARLTVRDTGCGMGEDVRTKLFEPFFTTKSVGTGMGLATVYGIVKQSGGYICVESEPDHGTTFSLYFPRVAPGPTPTVAAAPRERSANRGEQVLLVEDDESVRELITSMLELDGYHVTSMVNGEEALRFLEGTDRTPDLLITDLLLPGMNGAELAKLVQQRHAPMKMLYVSGYSEQIISGEGLLHDDTALLSKPFTRDKLLRSVQNALQSRA